MDEENVFTSDEAPANSNVVKISEEIKATVHSLWERANSFADADIWSTLSRCWRYYDGMVDFDPAYTLSQDENGEPVFHGDTTVVYEVWDKVQAILPDLARVFLASDEIVAYTAHNAAQEEYVEQATDTMNYIFREENDGENKMLQSFIAWLVKFCVWKVYWEEEIIDEELGGLVSQQTMMQIMQEHEAGELEITSVEPHAEHYFAPDPQTGMISAQTIELYNVTVKRKRVEGNLKFDLIPHDEALVDPDATCAEDALFLGCSGYRTVSDVVALGIPVDVVMEYVGGSGSTTANSDDVTNARRGLRNNFGFNPDLADKSLNYVRVTEGIARFDTDGDMIAERHRVLMLGDNPELVAYGPGNDYDIVFSSPYRRPHEVIGKGIAEQTFDLQDNKTKLIRGARNNFNRANTPRPVVNSTDIAAVHSLSSPFGPDGTGMILTDQGRPIDWHVTPYLGDHIEQLFAHYEQMSDTRIGTSRGNQGLDPDVLKGVTADGTKLVVNSGPIRIEYLVREYAASCVRMLFLSGLRILTSFQQQAKIIRLRGKWTDVYPGNWDGTMGCTVKVGLGTGTRQEKLSGILALIAQQDKERALSSPLVDWQVTANAVHEMTSLLGFKTTTKFFKEFDPEAFAQQQAAAKEEQKKAAVEAATLQAQLETQKEVAVNKVKGEVDVQKAQLTDQQHQRDHEAKESQAKRDHFRTIHASEIAAKEKEAAEVRAYNLTLEEIAAKKELELAKQAADFELRREELKMEYELERFKINNKQEADANLQREGQLE